MSEWFTGTESIVIVDTRRVATNSDDGDSSMADTTGDASEDCIDMIMDEEAQAHSLSMQNQRHGANSAMNILRHSQVKKYNEVDAIQAAVVDRILTAR